jgi:hypothetical protein
VFERNLKEIYCRVGDGYTVVERVERAAAVGEGEAAGQEVGEGPRRKRSHAARLIESAKLTKNLKNLKNPKMPKTPVGKVLRRLLRNPE